MRSAVFSVGNSCGAKRMKRSEALRKHPASKTLNRVQTVATEWGAQTRLPCNDTDPAASADVIAYGSDYAKNSEAIVPTR
jgi:hypothetical protein